MTKDARLDAVPALELRGIDAGYGRVQVLFDVSVAVAPGEALALLGTNGAGKSTLLRVATGLLEPTGGAVWLAGEDVTDEPAERRCRRGLALVPGGAAVFADMTVAENLEIYAFPVRSDPALVATRTEQALRVFPRLAERYRQPAGRLSGGEQQQLALSKALLVAPSVLCIDELSLGLAPAVVESLLGFVQELGAGGTTTVIVEQSLNVAAELCSRAVFLEHGTVRFEGSPRQLLDSDEIARAVFLGAQA